MTRLAQARHARAVALSLALGSTLVVAPACSGNKEPAPGQLMLSIQTDMAIPKDVDTVRIEVSAYGNLLFGNDYQVGASGLRIPATLALVAGKDPAAPVRIRVIARKGGNNGKARVLREVVTTVPTDRIAMLRIPIHWLCDGSAVEQTPGDVQSSCTQGQVCVAGTCQDPSLRVTSLETFAPEAVFGGASGPGVGGTCLDTVACFSQGQQAAVDLATCTVPVPSGGAGVNVAVLRAPNTEGICGTQACLVPLDAESAEGWQQDGQRAFLPQAVCNRIKDGKAQGVAVTTACPTKTQRVPPCGPWSSVETQPGTFDAPGVGHGGEGGSGGSGGADAGVPDSRPCKQSGEKCEIGVDCCPSGHACQADTDGGGEGVDRCLPQGI
jgi:hypothetical protein